MLFKSAEEIQQYVGLESSFFIESILPYVASAEKKYLIPSIGQPLYNDLNVAYQAIEPPSQPAAPYADLLLVVQYALAWFAVLEYISIGNVRISEAGIQMVKTESRVPAFEWAVDKIEDLLIANGYAGIDDILIFLEANASNYPDWTSSSAFSITNQFFINCTTDFQKYFNIQNSRRTFMALWPAIRYVEDLELPDILSDAYQAELKTKIAAGSLASEDKVIMPWLQAVEANLAIRFGFNDNAIQFNKTGVTVGNTNNRQSLQVKTTVNIQQRDKMLMDCEKKAADYLAKIRVYLDTHASNTVFPTYFASDAYTPPSTADYNAPANLITNATYRV